VSFLTVQRARINRQLGGIGGQNYSEKWSCDVACFQASQHP
jgi:hypothetical protein